jgi:hypothetical protein
MPTYDWHPAIAATRPIELGWLIVTPGLARWLRIQVDLLDTVPPDVPLTAVALEWWKGLLAPRLSEQATLFLVSAKHPDNPGDGAQQAGEGLKGLVPGAASSSDETPVLGLLTGHLDPDGYHRLYIPGTPTSWTAGGFLTLAGHAGMLTLGRALITGCGGAWGLGGPALISWRRAQAAGRGVSSHPSGFRYVEQTRIVMQTQRAQNQL